MNKTLAIVLTAAALSLFGLGACGNKNKNATTGPSTKTDAKAGAMGGQTYGGQTPGTTTTTTTTTTTPTPTPNPCGAGM